MAAAAAPMTPTGPGQRRHMSPSQLAVRKYPRLSSSLGQVMQVIDDTIARQVILIAYLEMRLLSVVRLGVVILLIWNGEYASCQ